MDRQLQMYVRDVLSGMSQEEQTRIREACQRDALFLCRVLEVLASVASATRPEGKMVSVRSAEAHEVAALNIKSIISTLNHHARLWSMVPDPDRAQLYEVLDMNAWLVAPEDEADNPGD